MIPCTSNCVHYHNCSLRDRLLTGPLALTLLLRRLNVLLMQHMLKQKVLKMVLEL